MALVAAQVATLSLGVNYGVHYLSSRLYDQYCIPHSWEGMIQSLVTTASPVCSFLLHTMTMTQNNYATIVSATIVSLVTTSLKPV
jgi:hypothetical protein